MVKALNSAVPPGLFNLALAVGKRGNGKTTDTDRLYTEQGVGPGEGTSPTPFHLLSSGYQGGLNLPPGTPHYKEQGTSQGLQKPTKSLDFHSVYRIDLNYEGSDYNNYHDSDTRQPISKGQDKGKPAKTPNVYLAKASDRERVRNPSKNLASLWDTSYKLLPGVLSKDLMICRGKRCRWAKCDKAIRLDCPAWVWATATTRGTVVVTEAVLHQQGSATDTRAEYSDFLHELGKRSTYVSFGREAEQCGRWALVKQCVNGHKVAKTLVCGREWCPKCGKKGSEAHNRRLARLIDRVYAMPTVGYLTFQIPLALRDKFEDIGMLSQASCYLKRLLKREGYSRGVMRWHYYGETKDRYHPHLNVLVQTEGYIGKSQLMRIRHAWSRWLKNNCQADRYYLAPVHYRYTDNEGRLWHWLKYITRATFTELTDDNRHIASDLFQFHNTNWFGDFPDSDKVIGRERFDAWAKGLPGGGKQGILDIEAWHRYETSLCPVCGEATLDIEGVIQFSKLVVITDYGGGLYQVNELPSYADTEAIMGIGCHL